MRRLALFVLLAAAAPAQNIVKLSDTAEIEFISPSCVRVARGKLAKRSAITTDTVTKRSTETGFEAKFETEELVVQFDSRSGLLSIFVPGGLNLFKETAATIEALDLEIRSSERFYGFGARHQPGLDARGLTLTPTAPFFISSRGYAFWMAATPAPTFDIGKTAPALLRVSGHTGDTFEYFFAFGPSVKEIWEERNRVTGNIEPPGKADLGLISMPRLPRAATALPSSPLTGTDLLCAETNALMHSTLSGQLLPAFDLARYRSAGDDTFRRALRLGVFSPLVYDSAPDPLPGPRAQMIEQARAWRSRLSHFLITYADEARYRGFPVLHSLTMQFPRDPQAGLEDKAFMFGDEFLLAPVCDGAPSRELYVPMGNWTDWNTNRTYQGRRRTTIETPADGLIVLVKNGAIVPLAGVNKGDPVELHYFPKNGGEFFLLEPDVSDYSQAHAGPAAGIWRVEIESKVARRYEWVIHHFDKPAKVNEPDGPAFRETIEGEGPLAPRSWRYDAANRQLRVGIEAPAKSDIIVNVSF